MQRSRWLLLLCFSLSASLSFAQTPSKGDIKKAKESAAEAKKFFDASDYEKALASFQRAFELNPKPGYLANIGQCYSSLGRYQEAIDSYERFLSLAPADDPLRAAVEKEIDSTRQTLVNLKESAARSAKASADEAFKSLNYEKALAGYQEAYNLSARPELQISIAQCYAALGKDQEALSAYRLFLEKAPANDQKRALVQGEVTKLEAKTAPVSVPTTITQSQPTKETPPPPKASPWPSRFLFGGVASGALGGVAGALALTSAFRLQQLSSVDDISAFDEDSFAKQQRRLKQMAPASDVLLITALVAGGVGLYLRAKQKKAEVSLTILPGATALTPQTGHP
jgi:tetratricopeptide (TPR) repeat protein